MSRGTRARSNSRMMHGGWVDARPLPEPQRERFDALVDTLIPPEDGWPDARTVGVADLASRYLVPDGESLSLYPHVTTSDFCALLDRVAVGLPGAALDERVRIVAQLEATEPNVFRLLRDFIYYVYYGDSGVVDEIRKRTRYGADFHGAPQPEGYDDSIEGWGDRPLVSRGVFIPTLEVTRTLPREGGNRVR